MTARRVVSLFNTFNCVGVADNERTFVFVPLSKFLSTQGHHQDKILKKTTSELNRLSNIVARLNGNRRDRSGDDTSKDSVLEKSKIYVGNVPHSYTSNQVKSYFEKFGEVTESFYVRCHENTNVGFVTFSDEKIMEAVLAARPHFIGNRKIIVERARKREAGKENLSQSTSTDGFKAGKMTTRTGRYSPY